MFMYKVRIRKIDSYLILGFLLSPIFFDVDAVEFLLGIKMESLIIVCCVVAWTIIIRSSAINSLVFAYMIYFGTLMVSTLINGNDIIALLYYAIRLITCVMLIQYMLDTAHFIEYTRGMKLFLIVVIGISVFYQIFNQDYFGFTESGNNNNFLVSDNYLGYYYIPFLLIVYICEINNRSKRNIWLCGIVCILSLIRGWSVGAMLSFVLFVVGMFLITRSMVIRKMCTFFNAIIINVLIFVLLIIFRIHTYFEWFIVGVLHKSMTLSLRTLIWDAAIRNILSNPIIGYGTCKVQVMKINTIHVYGGIYLQYFSHNYLLENMIQGGVLATLALVLVYAVVYRKSYECKESILYSTISLAVFCVMFMGQAGCVLFHPTIHFAIILLYYCKKIVHAYAS